MSVCSIEELLQAERLIREIEDDIDHGANNKSHPNHDAAKAALEKLKSKAAKTRAELEMKRYFHL